MLSSRLGAAAYMASALLVAAIMGWMVVRHASLAIDLIVLVIVALVVLGAPVRMVLWIAGTGVLVDQGTWQVVQSVGGLNIYTGDALAAIAVMAALAHTRHRTLWRAPLVLIIMLSTWAALRSEQLGLIAFGRILFPLVAMLFVVRIIDEKHYDLRQDLRWFPLAALASVFLLSGASAGRWDSIAGGPNQTGLVAAVAIVLGFTYHGRWRLILWATGALLLVGTASITASAAAVLGGLFYAVSTKRTTRVRLGAGSPLLAIFAVILAVLVIPLLRLDLVSTTDAHLFQVSKFGRVLHDGDWLLGTGWASVDRSAFFDSDVLGLHNVYLDVFAYLGAVGFAVFFTLLLVIWLRADVVGRSLLVAWLVWVNTSGAFPGTAWGLLAFIVAFAALRERREPAAEPVPVQQRFRVPAVASTSGHHFSD